MDDNNQPIGRPPAYNNERENEHIPAEVIVQSIKAILIVVKRIFEAIIKVIEVITQYM